MTGGPGGSGRRRRPQRGEQPMVPAADFTSYYGKPVINSPVWEPTDIAGYLFLGGLAGASSVLAAGAQLTSRPDLERTAKAGAAGAAGLALIALVHDLGRPARFHHMLRVLKVTSPMSVGSWLLAGYVPAAVAAATSALTGRARRTGTVATTAAAMLGPAVASYTAVLIADTAVPAWHDGYRQLPFVFIGSGAAAAGGLGLVGTPAGQNTPARNLALLGASIEAGAMEFMIRRIGLAAEPYSAGTSARYLRAARVMSAFGAAGAVVAGRSRVASVGAGLALIAGSAATRWGIFHAGLASAADPQYTVIPQRERLTAQDLVRSGKGRMRSMTGGDDSDIPGSDELPAELQEPAAAFHRDRHEHGKAPERLSEDQLARLTEEERVEAGIEDYDPDDVPPATE